MIIIGLDPHPSTHTAAAMNRQGAVLGTLTITNDAAGLVELQCWSTTFQPRSWAIEGAGNQYVRPLLAMLQAHGEPVFHVHPSLTSQYRARRGAKKNDVVDAENVARVVLANPTLPRYMPQEEMTQLQELARTRDRLAEQRKSNRMALKDLPTGTPATLRAAVHDVVKALDAALRQIGEELAVLVGRLAPQLLELVGVGPVMASAILAEVRDVARFPSQHHFASYCGAAPVERGSGKNTRWCVSTGGNRRLNRMLHLIALTRLRLDERTKTFVTRKEAEGKTKRASLRTLKTYLARELYQTLKRGLPDRVPPAADLQTSLVPTPA